MKLIMKYVIIFVSLFFWSTALAQDCTKESSDAHVALKAELPINVPNHLKGATITVTLADGKSSTVPAELFKVVPRKQQFIITHIERTTVVSCTTKENKLNRISLLGGNGPKSGLETSNSGTTTEVSTKVGFVGGVQYQRILPVKLLGMPLNAGAQVQNNKTISGSIGVDF